MHFGFGFGMFTSFGLGRNFGSKYGFSRSLGKGNRKTARLTDRVTDRQTQNEREMDGHSVRGGETNKHRNDMSVCVCV